MMKKQEIKKLDVVALTGDLPEHNLRRGEVGTVVEVFEDRPDLPGAFLIEFSDRNGVAYAFVELRAAQLMVLRYRQKVELEEAA